MFTFSKDHKELPVLAWLGRRLITSSSGETAELDFDIGAAAILGLKGVYALVIDELWEVGNAVCGCRHATQHVHAPAAVSELAFGLPEACLNHAGLEQLVRAVSRQKSQHARILGHLSRHR